MDTCGTGTRPTCGAGDKRLIPWGPTSLSREDCAWLPDRPVQRSPSPAGMVLGDRPGASSPAGAGVV
jgi:hypothetical protein